MAWHEKPYAAPVLSITTKIVDDINYAPLVNLRSVIRNRNIYRQKSNDDSFSCRVRDSSWVVYCACGKDDKYGK